MVTVLVVLVVSILLGVHIILCGSDKYVRRANSKRESTRECQLKTQIHV